MTQRRSSNGPLPEINVGYMPLIDSAVLIIAHELGFDEKYGFCLRLQKETSWANIRDKVNVGIYDCAHMLAPMPIAASLGLGHVREPIITPFALNLNGNAITVSRDLFAQMMYEDPECAPAGGMRAAQALAKLIKKNAASGHPPMSFGTVFPFSCHTYELSYWLASAGINPLRDVRLVVIPPSLIGASLNAGHIQGFCAGAPWPSLSVEEGAGRIIATKSELWQNSPEKVLGVRLAWVERNHDLNTQLLCALSATAAWLDVMHNRAEAAAILAKEEHLGLPAEILEACLLGRIRRDADIAHDELSEFLIFHDHHANFPWRSHALWLLTQMVRWGQLTEPFDLRQVADLIYRPDIYRRALRDTGISLPVSDHKAEGGGAADKSGAAGSHFGGSFDPSDIVGYLRASEIRDMSVDLIALADANK